MLAVRNRFIVFSIIKSVIVFILFKVVYKILKVLHLRLAALVGIAGLVLWLTGVFKDQTYLTAFYIALGASIALGAVLTIRKLFGGKDKGKDKDKKSKK